MSIRIASTHITTALLSVSLTILAPAALAEESSATRLRPDGDPTLSAELEEDLFAGTIIGLGTGPGQMNYMTRNFLPEPGQLSLLAAGALGLGAPAPGG